MGGGLPGPSGPIDEPVLHHVLQVDLQNGLSEFSVSQRRQVHGWNEFVADNTEPMWKKYLDQVGINGCINECKPEGAGWSFIL